MQMVLSGLPYLCMLSTLHYDLVQKTNYSYNQECIHMAT